MEGGRDARSVSEGRDAAARSGPPRRDSAGDERERPERGRERHQPRTTERREAKRRRRRQAGTADRPPAPRGWVGADIETAARRASV
ncbi:MAG: hypothetical protein DRP56_06345 [Planctomycetota bacterium]|nr:MAG: hypothetical protein DRP56_06345 [Planctomycetota bacterium]